MENEADAFAPPPDRDLALLAEYAVRRLPFTNPTHIVYAHSCRYTNTPDEDFALGWSDRLPGVFAVSACSGHGFKFTILAAKWAADALTEGDPGAAAATHIIGDARFSWNRFASPHG